MSTTVDERVVSMKFDNKQFENGVQETLSSLDKLKQRLNLTGATKGLENVDAAAKGVDISPLGKAAEAVSVKFSALQVAAVTVLSNITNTAVNAGKRIVSAFTLDPIKTGLAEYETQINAVQTILANTESKGTTLKDVNGALDQLNAYADKTIYNFTEMTRNIGTFTAAGIDLDTSVNAIQGIANLAAVSGSTSQQASTAMYQLSQALASGTVKLMDWNSVVNAGMGGQVFQDALKETARIHGVAIDDMITDEGSFRETLKNGWLTSEILTETLQKFTMATEGLTEEQIEQNRAMLRSKGYTDEQIEGIFKLGNTATNAATKVKTFTQLMDTLKESAQSGWTQTWELLIGDFEQAKELWTSVSDIFGKIINDSAEARNSLLRGWADGGGRDMALEAIKNSWNALLSVIRPIKEAFREVFPRATAEQLLKITEAIKDFTSKLILSDEASEKLKSTFKGLFAVVDIVVTIVKEVVKGFGKIAGGTGDLIASIVSITGFIGNLISKFRDVIKQTGFFGIVIGTVAKGVRFLMDKVSELVKFLSQKIVVPGFEGLAKLFGSMRDLLSKVAEKIVSIVTTLVQGLGKVLNGGSLKSILDLVNGGIFTSILLGIKKFFGGFGESIEGIAGIGGQIKEIFGSLTGYLGAMQKEVEAKTLMKIAQAILILAAGVLILAMIDEEKLTTSLMAIAALFGELMAAMAIFSKLDPLKKGLIKMSTAMISLSISVLLLAVALKTISDIEPSKLFAGVIAIAALTAIMVGFTKLLSMNSKTIVKGTTGLIAMAIAIKIMASACEDLSDLSWGEIARGLVGIAGLLAAVSIFLNTLPGGGTKAGGTILALSIGLLAMAGAMTILSKLSWESIGKGLAAVGGAMLILAVGLNMMKGTTSGAAALLLASFALGMMIPSLIILGKMKWETIGKGLLVLASVLLILGVAAYALKPVLAVMVALTGIVALTGLSLVVLGAGLAAIATAFAITPFGEIAKGLMAVGGAMIIFAASVILPALMSPLILLLAASLLVLGKALLAISGAFLIMPFGEIAKGLMALGGAMSVFALAALPALLLSPLILILGTGMLALGAGALALGTGLTLAAAGFSALAAAITSGGSAIINFIATTITTVVNLIPTIIKAVGEGIILLCEVLISAGPTLCQALIVIIDALLKALDNCIPKILETIFKLLDAVLVKLTEYIPKIVEVVFNIVIACLNKIAECAPLVVEAAVNIVDKFLEGLGQQIPRIIQAGAELIIALVRGIADSILYVVNAAIDIVIAFVEGIAQSLGRIVQAGWDLIVNFINGMADSIETNVPRVLAAVKRLFKAIINEAVRILTGGIVDLRGAGGNLIEGFKNGIVNGLSNLWGKVKSGFQKFGEKVKNFFGIHSPSTMFAEFGQYLDEGLVVGLNEYSYKVSDSAEGVGKDAVKSMSNAISGITDAVESDIDSQPTIKPVLDLSNVENGADKINGMFGMHPSVDVMSNVGSISSMMNGNRGSANADVISALKDLGNKLSGTSGDTYNINGVTYDDGSNIAEAIQTIIRAANIARRT